MSFDNAYENTTAIKHLENYTRPILDGNYSMCIMFVTLSICVCKMV